MTEIINQGSIPLPDPATCEAGLGTDPDPYIKRMCRFSQAIAANPTGDLAQLFQQAQADVAARDFNSQHVKWILPTRWAKAFHPRSPGMVAYRDAVLAVAADVGQV